MARRIFPGIVALTIGIAALAAPSAHAADEVQFTSPDRSFSFTGGIGYTFLQGDEIVYDDAGNRISHLIWESDAPVLTGRFTADIRGAWTLSGGATIGARGDSYMEDYDWLAPYSPSYAFDDWSHRSQHPDTRLHRYVDLDIAVGRNVALGDDATVNFHGGFKYTDVKWTAYGGSYVYSWTGFRADVGDFTPGVAGISFEQRYSGLFLGTEGTMTKGAWTLTGLLRGGFTLGADDTDHHWLRNLRFKDEFGTVPFVSLGARVDYAVNERVNLFLAGNYDRYFRRKGDTTMYDIPTGIEWATFEDGAGMAFSAATVSLGFKAAF